MSTTMKERVKAIVRKHNNPDNTGMIHLCDSAYYEHEEKGRDKRKRLFPVGTEVFVKPAHWCGDHQVFAAVNADGNFDYFDSEEIKIVEVDRLFETYPDAGYNKDRKIFDMYMKKFNNI